MKYALASFLALLISFSSFSQKGKKYFLIDSIEHDSLAINDKALIDSLLPIYHKSRNDTTKLTILSELSGGLIDEQIWVKYNNLLFIKSKSLLENKKSMNVKELASVKKCYARALQNKGYYIQNFEGDQEKAMEYYSKCLEIQREINDKEGISTTLNNMANTIAYQGNISKALELYFESLKLRESMKDKEGMAGAYNNIATTYMVQRDSAKALEYVLKSISILEEINHLYGLAFAYSNLGVIYRDRKDYETSRKYFEKSLHKWDEMRSGEGKGFAYQNIGFILVRQSENMPASRKKDSLFALAINYMNQGLKICEERNDFQGVASILSYLGNAYYSNGEISKALDYGLIAIRKAKESGFPPLIRNSSELLYKIYLKQQKWSDALEMHELYVQMRDSIFNKETQKSTFKQQMKYDYDKKQALKDAEHLKDLAVADEEKKRQRIFMFSVAAGLLLVIAFSFFIFNRLLITRKQKLIIEQQKKTVDQKNKHITDSINYAKRIQDAILPSEEDFKKCFSDHFIFFRPRDIVSGDFYWLSCQNEKTILVCADCTGHGVPGACMSMIGNTLLNEIINEKNIFEPAEILNQLNEGIVQALHQDSGSTQDDGMDVSVCVFNSGQKKTSFAGANHSCFIAENNHLEEIKGDIFSIGGAFSKKDFSFSQKEISLEKNQSLFLFTDGYADQPGGEKRKKFQEKNLLHLLSSFESKQMAEQKDVLNNTMSDWKGNANQIDDMLVIGIRI